MKNNRRSERVDCTIPVRWIRRSGDMHFIAAACNVHGLFLRGASSAAKTGELMHLQVALPGAVVEMFVAARFVGDTPLGEGVGVEILIMEEKQKTSWIAHYWQMVGEQRRTLRRAA